MHNIHDININFHNIIHNINPHNTNINSRHNITHLIQCNQLNNLHTNHLTQHTNSYSRRCKPSSEHQSQSPININLRCTQSRTHKRIRYAHLRRLRVHY